MSKKFVPEPLVAVNLTPEQQRIVNMSWEDLEKMYGSKSLRKKPYSKME